MKKKSKIIIFIIVLIVVLLGAIILKLFVFSSVEFKLKGDKTYIIDYGSKYKEKGIVAKINGFDYSKKVKIDDSKLDLTKVGEYKISYKLNLYFGKTKTITRTVKIVDEESPKIELVNGNYMRIDFGTSYVDPGYIVSDNYDSVENLKVNITYDREINSTVSGDYNITYEVVDTNGNITEVTRTLTVSPYEKIKVINGITYVDGVLIANKKYGLPSNYNPGINSEAYNSLTNMQNDANSLGYNIPLVSGFRSYWDQNYIYNNYVSIYGVEETDTFSARPGTSEHQTGLAFDVGAIDDNYGNTNEGIWLAENSHKYGFIIRYPQGKQHITGYKYEPWHIRYLGVDLATKVYNSGLTLEEYLGI